MKNRLGKIQGKPYGGGVWRAIAVIKVDIMIS